MMHLMREPKVSIIVLTFNSVSKLGGFFDKVLTALSNIQYSNAEILFIDNGSKDNTLTFLKRHIENNLTSKVRVIQLKRNYGWSGGNNRGALMCKNSDYLLFLNDDVIIEPDAITELVKQFEADKSIGAAQPLIINLDGTAYCGFDIGVAGFARPRILKKFPKETTINIFYAMGSALITRSTLFFRLGMFDEDYFYWYDDVDYCWRIRLAGFNVKCVTNAAVHHYGSATLGRENPLLSYYWVRNNILFCAKNYPLWNFILTIPLRSGEILVGGLGYSLIHRKISSVRFLMKGALDGAKDIWMFLSKKPILGKISSKHVTRYMRPDIDVELLLRWIFK